MPPPFGRIAPTTDTSNSELARIFPCFHHESPSTSAARAGPSSGDFGGSLGEILRTRDAEEFRERRRFFHSAGSFDEPGPEEREASHTRGRESDRDGDGDGYKNDKSLANRALCRLHRTKYKETSEEAKEECAICLENFKFGQVLAVFGAGCRHTFHQACIVEWFRTGDVRCPLCRYEEKNDYDYFTQIVSDFSPHQRTPSQLQSTLWELGLRRTEEQKRVTILALKLTLDFCFA